MRKKENNLWIPSTYYRYLYYILKNFHYRDMKQKIVLLNFTAH